MIIYFYNKIISIIGDKVCLGKGLNLLPKVKKEIAISKLFQQVKLVPDA